MKKIVILFLNMFFALGVAMAQGIVKNPNEKSSAASNQPGPTIETINGMKVRWAPGLSDERKRVIAKLIEDMVYVKGGKFMMGGELENDPAHEETVPSFRIAKYEVTQELWNAVNSPNAPSGIKTPVNNISPQQVLGFIEKLNNLTGLTFDLPLETEWEFAARGGTLSKGYKYSGGYDPDEVAWWWNNSQKKPHPVGEKQPNELGIYDMSGNVAELVYDNKGASLNPNIFKGGWFDGYSLFLSDRSKTELVKGPGRGFRLVLNYDAPASNN